MSTANTNRRKRKAYSAPQGVIRKFTIDLDTGQSAEVPPPTLDELLTRMGDDVAEEVQRIRSASRIKSTGRTKNYAIRLKESAVDAVEGRADALGVSVAEYIRLLIAADLGVVA